MPKCFPRFRHKAGSVAGVTAAVKFAVATEDFLVPAQIRDTNQMPSRDRGEIATDHQVVAWIFRPADVGEGAVLPIVAIDPLEPATVEIQFV